MCVRPVRSGVANCGPSRWGTDEIGLQYLRVITNAYWVIGATQYLADHSLREIVGREL